MGKSISDNFSELTSATQNYIDATVSYHKLDLYKKLVKGIVSGSYALILAFFLLIALVFISVAGAIYLGGLLESIALGYLIMGAFYLVITVVLVVTLKKKLETVVLQNTSKQLFNNNEDKNPPNHEKI